MKVKIDTFSGDPVVGQSCPKCREETVVYNGNYWCESCTWIMSQNVPRIIRAYLAQRFNEAKAKGDTQTMYSMVFYMTRI